MHIYELFFGSNYLQNKCFIIHALKIEIILQMQKREKNQEYKRRIIRKTKCV